MDLDEAWGDGSDLLGLRSDSDRAAEAVDKASAVMKDRLKDRPKATKTKVEKAPRSGDAIRKAIESTEGITMETRTERTEREAGDLERDSTPVMRHSGQMYHPRIIDGKVDVKVLQAARAQGITMMLAGYPGCGKTSLVEAAYMAEDPEMGPVTVAGHGEMEMSEIIGRYVVRPGNLYEWVDGPLLIAMKEGRVFFLDDATLIPSGVLARLYPVMDGRGVITVEEHEGETVKAEDGFYVVGAHNPGAPGAVLSEALASRFSLHIDVPTDFALASELEVDERVVRLAQKLTDMRDKDQISWAPAMRELLAYKKVAGLLSHEAAIRNFLSICPEVDREIVAEVVKTQVINPKPLNIGGRA